MYNRNYRKRIFAAQDTPATGNIKFGIFAVNAGMPVPDAKITVRKTGSEDIVEQLTSDSSGQSEIISLPAPPLDYSVNENSDQQPYSEYDILVESEGYEPTIVEGIQLLPDCEAIQNVTLNPRTTMARQEDIIIISPHTLWGTYPAKIPEAEEKPMPEESGFVVLSKPVIPEYIIVHDGSPSNTSAKNYWIPYKDYIKNVASSEIYATWPTQTIMANVLAIISFTLNRVYTEWYRAKGKNFTITSSTDCVKEW